MSDGFASGGMLPGGFRGTIDVVPCHFPASGTCIRGADGSHEWIIPVDPERTARNVAIFAEVQRKLALDIAPAIQPPALTED